MFWETEKESGVERPPQVGGNATRPPPVPNKWGIKNPWAPRRSNRPMDSNLPERQTGLRISFRALSVRTFGTAGKRSIQENDANAPHIPKLQQYFCHRIVH